MDCGRRMKTLASTIVTQLRLPRAVLALEVGAALGLSGAVLQGVTRNPLAEPGLLGVSAGAALGAVIAVYFGLATHFMAAAPLLGLIGALLASMLTFALGRGGGTITLVLAGAAVSALAAAGIVPGAEPRAQPVRGLRDHDLADGFAGGSQLGACAAGDAIHFIGIGNAVIHLPGAGCAGSGGNPGAESRNQPATALRVGGIRHGNGHRRRHRGYRDHRFHRTRGTSCGAALVGHQPSRVLLPAALSGALLLLFADVATRLIHAGSEMKLGVLTSLIGTPFFFWLVVRLRKMAP